MDTYDPNASAAMMAGFGLVGLIFGVVGYILFAVCMKKIAEKAGHTENSWWAWIPIMQILLIFQIAQKPMWWIILLIIPLVNIVILIIVYMEVAKAVGKEGWWGIIAAFIPIIGLPYLAFSDGGTEMARS